MCIHGSYTGHDNCVYIFHLLGQLTLKEAETPTINCTLSYQLFVPINMSQNQNMSDHDCDVCGNIIPWTEGRPTCEEHFCCTGCLIEVFERPLRNIAEFPASCCGNTQNGTRLSVVDSLFGDSFLAHYKSKLEIPPGNRVYCANVGFAKFQRLQAFHDYTVKCECDTMTCVHCKTEHGDGNSCSTRGSAGIPPYSLTCRIKQCPECRQ